ncbi:hypothetical protein GN958_ATG08528 [Phytophthora infestans]|uniref:Uncharacterized protein n=1 Tax=Phytophthora infestans TaxID=4787 RepID=A0A8S9UST7_PHYIN|nr:hypothetical protein GN958_ATG08528 [Phytophthora infestans]
MVGGVCPAQAAMVVAGGWVGGDRAAREGVPHLVARSLSGELCCDRDIPVGHAQRGELVSNLEPIDQVNAAAGLTKYTTTACMGFDVNSPPSPWHS